MGTIESHLEVINNTSTNIVNTSVNGIDRFDWDGNSRPDHNFQGVSIACRGGSVERREELNKQASHCPFNMTLYFSDGSQDVFRIHQKHAVGCCAGFQHMTRSHDIYYNRSGNKLVIKVENTQQQLQNERAEQKNKEGEAAMRQKQYEAAMKKFDEALSMANQSSTINSIKNNKSESCNQIAKNSLQKAWDLEADSTQDKSQEAQAKFTQAKSMFEQAQALRNTSEQKKNLNLVNLKIDGNRLFNEANELEKKAFGLFENSKDSDYTTAQNMYKEAVSKYQEAAKKFEEGSKVEQSKFDESVKIVTERIQDVKKVVEDIERAELSHNIGKVSVEDKTEKSSDELVNKNLQEQVDVVPC